MPGLPPLYRQMREARPVCVTSSAHYHLPYPVPPIDHSCSHCVKAGIDEANLTDPRHLVAALIVKVSVEKLDMNKWQKLGSEKGALNVH